MGKNNHCAGRWTDEITNLVLVGGQVGENKPCAGRQVGGREHQNWSPSGRRKACGPGQGHHQQT